MVLVVILTMCLLVVDMLDVFSLVSRVGFNACRMVVSKAFVFLTCRTLDKLVLRSLQNVFRKLLVFSYTQLEQRNGPTLRSATHFVDVF